MQQSYFQAFDIDPEPVVNQSRFTGLFKGIPVNSWHGTPVPRTAKGRNIMIQKTEDRIQELCSKCLSWS
jgi:hypothetical protein